MKLLQVYTLALALSWIGAIAILLTGAVLGNTVMLVGGVALSVVVGVLISARFRKSR